MIEFDNFLKQIILNQFIFSITQLSKKQKKNKKKELTKNNWNDHEICLKEMEKMTKDVILNSF